MNELDLAASTVKSLYTERHSWLMYGLIRWLRPENCVEVGSYAGYASMHIAKALEDNGKGHLFCIDDYSLGTSASDIHNNLLKVGASSRVTLISGDSKVVEWPKRIDFAFIDGDHSLNGCLSDCDKAIDNGASCVCVHDTQGWWGPRDYLEMFREQSVGVWDVFEQSFDSGLGVLIKRDVNKPPLVYTEESHPQGHA